MNKGLLALFMVCLSISSLTVFEAFQVLAAPAPTVNTTVTPGNEGPCTWFVSLDGTTPMARAMVAGLSVNVGDNVVGTSGHFMTLWNTLVGASQSICLSDGTFTVDTADLGSNLGLNVFSNDRVILSRGTIVNQVAAQYLGNLAGSDQNKGIFTNADHVNGNTNIEVTGGTIIGTQPNAANTSYSNCIRFIGASQVWVHDIIADGCGIQLQTTTPIGVTEPITQIGGQSLTLERIKTVNHAPYGISLSNPSRALISEYITRSQGSIDDVIAIQNSAEDVMVINCWLDKFINVGGYTNAGNPIRMQGNSGAWGYSNIYIRENNLFNGTNNGQAGLNFGAFGAVRNVLVTGNYITKGSYGVLVNAGAGTVMSGLDISNNDVYNNQNSGISIESATTQADTTIAYNRIFDNGISGTNPYAIRLLADNTHAFSFVNIDGNIMYDNKTSVKQTNQIAFGSAGSNWDNVIVSNNYMNQTAFAMPACCPVTMRIKNNVGYNPVGKITAPFINSPLQSTPFGASAAPTASNSYIVQGTDQYMTSSGGTGVSITISCAGNNLVSGAATITNQVLWIGCSITFGAFSVAPTVTDWSFG